MDLWTEEEYEKHGAKANEDEETYILADNGLVFSKAAYYDYKKKRI
jgi:hypothetical protein